MTSQLLLIYLLLYHRFIYFLPILGEDSFNNSRCVPFVSEYSDCSEANYCSGCNRCYCNGEGEWQCEKVFECPIDDDDQSSDQNTIASALDVMVNELRNKEKRKARPLVPPPPSSADQLIVPENNPYHEDFETYFSRQKRSVKEDSENEKNKNSTIHFFNVVDEINEDTLKKSNKSGTIEANKVQANRIPKISRRTSLYDNINKSATNALHIKYNQPQDYEHHIAENKIDATTHHRNKLDEKELQKLIGNYSQNIKDKDLSKLVVNELKPGDEVIGAKTVSPTSNITFTPENDTLTAMAFIAGNLLSKLWEMEKDENNDSIETEVLKHEKINDLLELFKEPLSIRQETFLKNALYKLSNTLNQNKSVKNVSICETISEPDNFNSSDEEGDKDNIRQSKLSKPRCDQAKITQHLIKKDYQYNISHDVVSKLNNVLGLIKKFESVQKYLKDINNQTSKEQVYAQVISDIDQNASFEQFGGLLNRITRLLIPNKSKSKNIIKKTKKTYLFQNKNLSNNFWRSKYNLNLSSINMSAKDKIILEYINHIENNPNCLFKNKIENKTSNIDLNIEGNILGHLSEFLKIKSFAEIFKVTQPEYTTVQSELTTEKDFKMYLRNSTSNEISKLNITKEKLKSHLKAIIDDLLDLQKEHGTNNDKKVNIIDALPCIYNILNVDNILKPQEEHRSNVTNVALINKMIALTDTIKSELEISNLVSMPMRRNNMVSEERPQSAKIWDRMIKNINKLKTKNRRSFTLKQHKSYNDIKKIMEQVELMGNSYKNFALFAVTPPHKRLMLLKTLEANAKQQYHALTNINNSMHIFDRLPVNEVNDVKEFIENVGNNIQSSVKVLENLDKIKRKTNGMSEVEVLFTKTSKTLNQQSFKLPKLVSQAKEKVLTVNREQILAQLMMNRVQFYLRSKEGKEESDLNDDINYKIGKRILFLIQSGNLNVAKELFTIFMSNKGKQENLPTLRESTTLPYKKRAPLLLALKEPLMTFYTAGRESGSR